VQESDETPATLSRRAANQGAYLFLLAGLLGLAGMATEPHRHLLLVGIAVVDFVVACLCFALPWQRWPVSRVAWVSLAAFAVMGVSTWGFHGYTGGTIPFYVLTFTWLGLHQTTRVIALASIPATISYAAALAATGAPGNVIGTTVVLMPVVVAVGLVISRRVRGLREAQEHLRAQEQWRSAMVSTLAHDIRSPLTSITGALEIISDDEQTPDRHRPFLEAATRQTERITRLAGSLLDLERVEQGKLRLNREHFGLHDLAREVVRLTAPGRVVIDIAADATAYADRDRVEQILVNLTNNALRHGSGPVVIGARAEPDAVVLSVRDHGTGVSHQDAPNLFTRLAHGHPGTDSVGLGLWIVRTLTEAHGGTVRYENADPGAVFLVRLPAAAG
jgi:signal transduction histidine kinase